MKITIQTPSELEDERIKLIQKAIKTMESLEKYNIRMRKSLQFTLYKIHKIDSALGKK